MGEMMYEDLKDMLCMELEKIVQKGELSAGSLETVHKLTDTIKNIDKIEMLDEQGGYSEADEDMRGYGRADRPYSRAYDRGSSYARRDMRGRYARGGESMKERIREMMHEPGIKENERKALERALDMFN